MTERRRTAWPRLAFARAPARAKPPAAQDRFAETILPLLDPAYGYARYLTRDDFAAEDVVQDAFLRAFRSIDTCRGHPKAWLFTIVRNCFHDWARTNGRELPADAAAEEQPDPETPGSALERARAVADVRTMIESLPEPFRATLVLRELEEMSYRAIADITAVPVGTVMSRLARGRAMLAALLLGDGEGRAQAEGRR